MKDGHIVEFRLHLKEMYEAADEIGHELYKEHRNIEALSKTRNLTIEEKIKISQLKKRTIQTLHPSLE
ncbi:hypothetical protein [Ferruginibacter profundus]